MKPTDGKKKAQSGSSRPKRLRGSVKGTKAMDVFKAERQRERKLCVRDLRGKYKHLDLMEGLVEARKDVSPAAKRLRR